MEEITLNREQSEVLQHIMAGEDVFVTGGAGVGKTVLLKEAKTQLQRSRKRVVIAAPTGIAAYNAGGTTMHRLLNLIYGTAFTGIDSDKLKPIQHATPVLRKADVIMIDEVSMVRADLMDSFLASVRKAEKKEGKHIQICIFGDFYQLPPVLDENSEDAVYIKRYYGEQFGTPYAFKAHEWKRRGFKVYELTEIVRQRDDIEFVRNLNLIRKGSIEGVDWINSHSNPEKQDNAPFFVTTNDKADFHNRMALEGIPGERIVIAAQPVGENLREDKKLIEDIGDGELVFKVGARVMAVRNSNNENARYFNGMQGTLLAFVDMASDSVARFRTAVVQFDGVTSPVIVGPVRTSIKIYVVSGENILEKDVAYLQLPLRLAYALTIHKAQGLTCEKANVDSGCSFPGQLYVALSRVKRVGGLHLSEMIDRCSVIAAPDVYEYMSFCNDASYHFSWEPPVHEPGRPGRRRTGQHGTVVKRIPLEISNIVDELTALVSQNGNISNELYADIMRAVRRENQDR